VLVAVVALTLLHGTVRIGPITPVCRAGTPCTRAAAGAVLTFARGSTIRRVRTDRAGRYRIRLAPGTWTVRTNVGMRLTPLTVLVPRAASATRNFSIDTGIR
jgi:hypothetical protein